jgi:DNA polymerase-4
VFVREAAVIHADLDAFYASVEQRDEPKLRGKPVIVGGGVVLSSSYEARACGVRTAMGGTRARRLCPNAIVVRPRMDAYSAASKQVFAVFEDMAPVVEGLSIDEAFLDVRGLEHISGTPVEIGRRLRERVRDECGLPITVGIARTKFLAKVASGVAKPDGLLLVPPDGEREFLHPLPVERLWGVGEKTTAKLNARGLVTVADVAAHSETELMELLGPHLGRHLHALASGRDPRPVQRRKRRRSMGAQHALGPKSRSFEQAEISLFGLIDRVTKRMRAAHRVARTVVLRLRFSDFTRATRSRTLAEATADTRVLLAAARELLAEAAPLIERQGITLVGVSLTNLDDAGAVQPTLPFEPDRGERLDAALDGIRERFGSAAVTRAVLVGRDPGISVPLLPDD